MYIILILAGALASASPFMDYVDIINNCTQDQFICHNLECISQLQRCDGKKDCTDNSDELGCDMYLCEKPHYFRCKNNRCISSSFVCDNENDCEDFTDETNCEEFKELLKVNTTCPAKEWQCTDKLCIPQNWVCNGQADCLDGSDETIGCATMQCDGFKCKNDRCISSAWRCDGKDDCKDKSDEMDCDTSIEPDKCTLESRRFLCKNKKNCLKLENVCDGNPQCPDKSDEGFLCNSTCTGCNHDCVHLPSGAQCLCPLGYKNVDIHRCEDINECEQYGVCDQKCKNIPGSYQCICDDGYTLEHDGRSCKSHYGEAVLYFSSKTEIRSLSLKSEIYLPVVKDLKQVVGVDYDGDHVYWTDIFSEHESIVRSKKDGTKKELLVTSGLGSPEDLKIDHYTGNIYFTDAERCHIGVCTNDGLSCAVLVNKDINKPRGIVLHPKEGEMYWTDWGKTPKIARSNMDGSDDISFVTNNIHWPNGLAIDSPNGRLYWTDAKLMSLESIKLDGTDRRIVLNQLIKHPYAIAVFEDKLYWSDWGTRSIESCNKFTGKDYNTLIREDREYIYGISIYHANNRKEYHNPCRLASCSDICLLKGTSYKCSCPPNKELNWDQHTCKEIEKKQQLVLGADNILARLDHKILGKHEVTTLPVFIKKIGALAYNSIENVIYISDLETKKIITYNLHTGVGKPLDVNNLGKVISMDFDYLGNNLYWCDSEKKTLEVLNLNTKAQKVLLHDMHGETPESVALVPEEGVMFVAFKITQEYHIDRILMDGTGRTHSLEEGLLGPITLHYDIDLHRIFISDAGTGNIETTSVEGDDRHGFRSLHTYPIDLTTLKREVFWVNKRSHDLYWADKYNTAEKDYNRKITLKLPKNIGRIYITSITPQKMGLSPCQHNNGNCSHLCLHSHQTIVCACPLGMVLDTNLHKCFLREECNSSEFLCWKSNVCIKNKFYCDGISNCPNNEDEELCSKNKTCNADEFQCNDGECIKKGFRCDYTFQCKDKSDEHNCNKWCPPNQFRCNNGKCIENRFVCNGINDCQNKEDEAKCERATCESTEFRCLSGACIPKSWECDQDYDCNDMSDEHLNCGTCEPTTFTCNNGKCVDLSFVCDKENDCGDNSDEMSCSQPLENCPLGQFACTTNITICLPHNARCNGTSECPFHDDEKNCSHCRVDEFSCKNKKCIPTQWICDHSDDCGDNSDEEKSLCNHQIPQTKMKEACNDKFQCKTGNCIEWSLVCNEDQDCFDGSDEGGMCSTACNALNNPCNHMCVKTPTGPKCKCNEGFELQGDGKHCLDIDECDIDPPVCSQICHNNLGDYQCNCYQGFIIRNDKNSCKAEGKAMSMLFVTKNQIRELSQTQNTLKLLHSEDGTIITGLDVSASSGDIYYSLKKSRSILLINKNTSTQEFIEEVGEPQQISLDWITNNLYYINDDPKSISICNFNDKTCAQLLSVDNRRQLSAIAVDGANQVLFYSLISWWVFKSPTYIIYKTNLDGSEPVELVKSSMGYITGLSFDPYKKELYFIDQYMGQLKKIKYDGLKPAILASNLTSPNGLIFFENHLFFINKEGLLGTCQTYQPTLCHYVPLQRNTFLFTINQQSRQPEFIMNACKNHTCSHLCIPTKFDYKCLCSTGKLIAASEKCDSFEKNNGEDGHKLLAIHHIEDTKNPHLGPVIAEVTTAICVVAIIVALYVYIVRKRNSGSVNISMRFHNPAYGIQIDEPENKTILQPGKHEYTNPVEFIDAGSKNDLKNLLANV